MKTTDEHEAFEYFKVYYDQYKFTKKSAGEWIISAIIGSHPTVFDFIMSYAKDKDSINEGYKHAGLGIAVKNGHLGLTRVLIEKHNAPMEVIRHEIKESVLTIAVIHKQKEIVEYLIHQGADISVTHQRGKTLLLTAVNNGDWDTTKILCHAGADLNTRISGLTPLHYAIKDGQEEIAHCLATLAADGSIPDHRGRNAMHYACETQNLEMLKHATTAKANINAQDHQGLTPLMIAVQKCSTTLIEYLFTKGAAGNIVDNSDKSALHHAVDRGDVSVYKLLVDIYGKAPATEKTPLYVAVEEGKLEIVRAALEGGWDTNRPSTKNRYTPLHLAAIQNKHEIVRELMKIRVDTECTDRNSRTPLFLAVMAGNYEAAVELLTDSTTSHSNPNATDKTTQSILTQAVKIGRLDLVKLILSTPSYQHIDQVDTEEGTSLHYACTKGHVKIIQELLKAGANPEARSIAGRLCTEPGRENIPNVSLETIKTWRENGTFVETTQTADDLRWQRKDPKTLWGNPKAPTQQETPMEQSNSSENGENVEANPESEGASPAKRPKH